eukprot:CAMPEP_0197850608 /NCGR_PEP_ID=MMETSP1438-20131217/15859_1 /TAXON_ID=1461541 /ORGANISM="Pterosperma sp., Strain CCMP1384" /LENGTH=76 /DNA_ID=CAMNT_0043463857 /DNA_START=147 /DNA_END=377 /DNA_ORIENTATION=+
MAMPSVGDYHRAPSSGPMLVPHVRGPQYPTCSGPHHPMLGPLQYPIFGALITPYRGVMRCCLPHCGPSWDRNTKHI